MELHELGWDPAWEHDYTEQALEDTFPARVTFHSGKRYSLASSRGEIDAVISGAYLQSSDERGDLPCVGDWAVVRKRSEVHPYEILSILPRRNKLSRKVAGRRSVEQLIAANVDIVFIVTSADEDFNVRRLERYLAMVREINAEPVILVNKMDACSEPNSYLKSDLMDTLDVPIHGISARDGTDLEQVTRYIESGKTIVLIGSSGVGKSTLINRLLGYERQAVGEIRESDGKGRHVTTSRELVILPGGGIMIDNPGIREIQLWSSEHGISRSFNDIEEMAGQCRFRDCQHDSEPGCAVKMAVQEGELSERRFENYRKLKREQENMDLRRNTYERRKHDRKLSKMYRLGDEIRKYKERK